MKGTISSGRCAGKFGGDFGAAGKQPKTSARNIRRLMKKYPNDIKIQEILNSELRKY